jgi:hypothetical protein
MNENLITRTRVTVTLPIQNEDFVEALYDNLPDTMILAQVFTTDDGDPVSATFYLSEEVTEFDLGLEIGILSNIYTETLEETLELADLGLTDDDELKDCVNSLKDIAANYSSYLSDDRMNVIGQNGNDGEHYSGSSGIEDDYCAMERSELDYGEMDDNIGIDAQGQYYIKDEDEEEDQDVDYNYFTSNLDHFCGNLECDEECQDEEDCDERATERYSRDTTGGVEFTLPPQEYVYDEEESINVIHSMIMKDPELNKKEDDDSPLGRLFRSFNDFYKKDDNI